MLSESTCSRSLAHFEGGNPRTFKLAGIVALVIAVTVAANGILQRPADDWPLAQCTDAQAVPEAFGLA